MSTTDPTARFGINSFSLVGRRVLVTGGTRGIGAAIACGIAAVGGDVLITGFGDDDAGSDTLAKCRQHDVRASAMEIDMSRPPTDWLDEFIVAVDEQLPGIDCIVNNAGMFGEPGFLDVTAPTYDKTMNLNVAAGYFITQAFSRRWIQSHVRGRVVFTGSINGQLSEPGHSVYDTSKGAVAAMVRSLCVALAPHGIRVNSMAPGLIRTPLTEMVFRDNHSESWMKRHTPNGKVPSADACVGATIFLLSDAADHIHGQTLMVDGGMSAWQQPDPPRREDSSPG
ncbi:MAG: SDR family oxidoreductase [Planctomycetota bacterium]